MNNYIWPKDVKWQERPIIKMHDNPPPESQWEYKILLPDWLADWDVFADWEVERFNSMRDNLKQGDVLFDIGAEVGWQSIIYGQFVGAENMVLIESSAQFWPNIKATWRKNYPAKYPLQCHYGLFSDKTTGNFVLPRHLFPVEAEAELIKYMSYRYVGDHGLRMQQMKLDDFVSLTKITPNALTIDTEGSELLILQGAEETLRSHNLKVWVSVHPELLEKNDGATAADIYSFMEELGYSGELLAVDHEEHVYFTKAEK